MTDQPPDEPARLTNREAAALAGIAPGTWRDYVARGYAPTPDGRLGVTPWWWESTVRAWLESRPGQGARTDLTTDTSSTSSEEQD